MPDWRHPTSRAPEHATAHGAEVAPAPQAVGAGGIVPEHVLAVHATERLQAFGLALSPRDSQDRWPSIGLLAQLGHSCYSPLSLLPCPNTGGETSVPPGGGVPVVSLLLSEVSPPLRRIPPGCRHPGRALSRTLDEMP